MSKNNFYSRAEENINIYSHGFGFFLSCISLIMLFIKGFQNDSLLSTLSYCIFALSLIFLYFASTYYHSTQEHKKRFKLKVLDHCAIYVLIAGSYTPYALISLKGNVGWTLFGITWTFAGVGIILKLFFTGRFKIISTLMYLLMGWLIVFFAKPLAFALSDQAIYWLMVGGLSYTIGALFYSIKKIKYNHAIFHIFVLAGSISHFISIYFYV